MKLGERESSNAKYTVKGRKKNKFGSQSSLLVGNFFAINNRQILFQALFLFKTFSPNFKWVMGEKVLAAFSLEEGVVKCILGGLIFHSADFEGGKQLILFL